MKNYLEQAVLDKVSEDKDNDWLVCGSASMQGWRVRQEDAHFCLPDFDENVSLFGVFDGHGGVEVARYAAEMLPNLIKFSEPYRRSDYSQALIHAFREFDESLMQTPVQMKLQQLRSEGDAEAGFKNSKKNEVLAYYCGSTAVVALLAGTKLFVANIGDSRCLIGSADKVVIPMTSDHTPLRPREADRIRKAGGHVSVSGRVNHDINMSRAFGDYAYKSNRKLPADQQMLISVPDIRVKQLDPENGVFIVLVCDGIWNAFPNYCIADFIAHRIHKTDLKLSEIGERLCDVCYNPCNEYTADGKDNMTCVIVKYKQGGRRVEYLPSKYVVEDEEEQYDDDAKNCDDNVSSSLVEAIKLY